MAARIAQLSLFGVALIIGLLLVGQLRSQAGPIELSNLSAQELSELIEQLQAANVEDGDGSGRAPRPDPRLRACRRARASPTSVSPRRR